MLGNMYQYPYQPAPQPMPQYQQAYQPQMPQYQQKQFSPITGRIVSNAEEIMVQEVPTDGNIAWFPAADGSCVYGKRWTPDGNITTLRFVPEAVEPAQPAPDPERGASAGGLPGKAGGHARLRRGVWDQSPSAGVGQTGGLPP